MPSSEFKIIEKYFKSRLIQRRDVKLGIGDDAALLKMSAKQLLAVSMDTLVAGVHFPHNTSAADIGYKALAVNLSDMAAMGAEPAWATLALTLPQPDEKWLRGFARGFFELAQRFNVQLVGGDTTRGDCLSITVQIHGFIPPHKALRRDSAKAGDDIYITGTLGDAGLALELLQRDNKKIPAALLSRLNRPTPRVAAGLALRDIASSAIDLSDGLSGDLQHILKASNLGATLYLDQLPLSRPLKKLCSPQQAIAHALYSGDDYELCFTASKQQEKKLLRLCKRLDCAISRIGSVEKKSGLRLLDNAGNIILNQRSSFQHF